MVRVVLYRHVLCRQESSPPEHLCRILAAQIILACGVDPPSQGAVVEAESAVAQRLNRQPADGPGWSDWGWLGRLADHSLTQAR